MKIIVCAKYALDVAEIKLDSSGKPQLEGVHRKVSDVDKNAMEAALNLREKQGGTINAVCFGPASAREGLKELLAMGADEAFLVEDPSGMLDTAATAEALASAIQKMGGFDLILCGEATIDGYTCQVGPRLAGKLGIPQITYARNLNIKGNIVIAQRDLEDAFETVSVPMPVLVSVTHEINVPRIPSLIAILKASKKPVTIWKLEDMGLSKEMLEQVSTLRIIDLHGFAAERKRMVFKDKPVEEAVREVISHLLKEKVIEG
jgi:electron transfer flavoprotein beta subunit